MKKIFALVVMLCAVMISSTASAAVALCEQDVSTVTQKLQELPDIKIWGMEKKLANGISGYSGYFGDSKNNCLTFLTENDGTIKAVGIESQFGDDKVVVEQMLKLACGTLVIAGVTLDDVANLMQEIVSDMEKALANNSKLKKYEKTFYAPAQTGRKIVLNFSAKEITSDFGEFKFIIFAE